MEPGSLNDAFLGTDVGAWTTAIVGSIPGSLGGGCDGPAVNFNAVGARYSGHPLSACGAPLSTAALVSKALITLFVSWFGAVACVRALGSGFGWNPGVGQGGGSA